MRLSRIQILNFRNFKALDVSLGKDVVLIGPNRVGKSNFLHALRLVLDTSLPDAARRLRFSDVWDGSPIAEAPAAEIHIDIVEFDNDPDSLALLTDYRVPTDSTTARLS